MNDEKKAIVVAIIFGVIDTAFNIIGAVKSTSIIFIIGILLSIVLVLALLVLYHNYRKAEDSYEFIKFLFFGSEYNGFSLFPKLKVFMDYIKKKNQVEVETIDFECVDDKENNFSYVQWVMKNVYNKTKEEVKSYYLYTANEYGKTSGINIEVKEGNRRLNIDTDNIEKKNKIQMTPFTFVEPIRPGGRIPEIKIKMDMHDDFGQVHQKIVYLYPRNYGTNVMHLEITYKTRREMPVSIVLHEIGKAKGGYFDRPIKSSVPNNEEGIWIYNFSLQKHEINVNNLYYLFIRDK